MKPSFRVVLFINILLASVIIIIANRVAIQIFLPLQIKEELKTELVNYVAFFRDQQHARGFTVQAVHEF